MKLLQRSGAALLAVAAFCTAVWLAMMHPVAPMAALASVWLVAAGTVWRPAAWLFWLPALMPVLNFFPWTGWWLVDESDLVVLAVLAGGYLHWAIRFEQKVWPCLPRWLFWLLAALAVCVTQAVWRGWQDALPLPPHTGWADTFRQGLFADHLSAWNSVRVAKAFVWAMLLAPLAWHVVAQSRRAAGLAFVRGMVAGLALVLGLVVWERESQVGLLDFVSGYRTAAAFWEMHVGGGAIDAYLALVAPMALWAVWMAPSRWRAWLAVGLLWLTIYGLLTTYSRGVVGAFVIVVLGWALAVRTLHMPHDGQGPGRRRVVAVALAGLLVQGVVIGSGAVLGNRLEETSKDLLGRWVHWQRGVGLLQDPVASNVSWWGGLGMGRFTAQYSRLGGGGELPGRVQWLRDGNGQGFVILSGPDSRPELALQFGLQQRVNLTQSGGYTARLRLAGAAGDEVLVSLCQRHLLHALACQWEWVTVEQRTQAAVPWHSVVLKGHRLPAQVAADGKTNPLSAVLTVHTTRVRQSTQLLGVELRDAAGVQWLRNTRFEAGLSHWMPAAEAYYQPWHVDNLYLDLWLELGLIGFSLLAGLTIAALLAVRHGMGQRDPVAWALGASLLGILAVGALISLTEVPRVMLLALLTLFMAQGLWTNQRAGDA